MWSDIFDAEQTDALTRRIRATTQMRGAAEIRVAIEVLATRERRRRAAVQVWERATGSGWRR